MAEVQAIVLETDGTFSVIHDKVNGQPSSLSDVAGYSEDSGEMRARAYA